MGLEALSPGAPPVKQAKNTIHASRNVSHAPALVPASRKKRGQVERIQKVACIGPGGSGKTFMVLSLVKHLALELKMKAEQIRIELIDLDCGIDELTDQCIIPDEYLDRIFISTCQNFVEVTDATHDAYERLAEHKKQYGLPGCWIIVDNMERAWQYPQEDYCQAVYGMSLTERMKHARKTQVEANRTGQKGEPVFNQQLDWGTITPMYNDWAKSFEVCGFNFLWLSPWKPDEKRDKSGNIIEVTEKFGNGGNNLKVSHIIRKYFDANGNRRADFVKSRSTKGLPRMIADTTWTGIFKELSKLEALELQEHASNMKLEGYIRTSESAETTAPDVSSSTDDVVEQYSEQTVRDDAIQRIMNDAVANSPINSNKMTKQDEFDW